MPTLTDYVRLVYTLLDRFLQEQQTNAKTQPSPSCPPQCGPSFTYAEKALIAFLVIMQFRRVTAFKAQRRWLGAHPEMHA
ncbi:MAG: hypothetical protein ACR2GR_05895, partial [Rhodothermales bacterium]